MFTSLPVEIITKIFQSLDGFDAAISLACSSQFLHSIFKDNKRTILPSVLRRDPLVAGVYDKAVILHHALQQKYGGGLLLPGKKSPPPNSPHFVDSLTGAVTAIVHNAHVINRTSSAMHADLFLSRDLGYDDEDRNVFNLYAFDLLREALYDIWISILSSQQLVQPYHKGRRQGFQHPSNTLITANFCHYMVEGREWRRRCGFPNPKEILPSAATRYHLSSPRDDARSTLHIACDKRRMEALAKQARERLNISVKAKTILVEGGPKPVGKGKGTGVSKTTIAELRKRVADLEASEAALKERVKISEADIEEMKRMWRERFGS